MKAFDIRWQSLKWFGFAILAFSFGNSAMAQSKTRDRVEPQNKSSNAVQQPPLWHWRGIEIMGNHSVSRDKILAYISIEMGTEFIVDKPLWKSWEVELVKHLDFHAVHIGAVRYVDRNGFLVIDIVERGNEKNDSFRAEPKGTVDLPQDLLDAHRRLSDYHQELFQKGTPPAESADKGFVEYGDAEMNRRVQELVRIAPRHRQTLIKAITEDSREDTRAKAATLLNWAGEPQQSIMDVLPLLNDPSSGVRNNLTRFMDHFFDQIKLIETKKTIVDAIIPQLNWPSHGDRNKAIYALTALAKNDNDVLAYIMSKAEKEIRYIAENSILYNVRDPARDLLGQN